MPRIVVVRDSTANVPAAGLNSFSGAARKSLTAKGEGLISPSLEAPMPSPEAATSQRPRLLIDVDSHARALAKAATWRGVATIDTFLLSFFVTRHVGAASAIAGMEIFTKIALYYFHERGWRLVGWAPNARMRSLSKAVSWRVIGGLDTFILSYIITGNAKYAISITSLEAVTKIVLYYIHERGWRLIPWGRLEASAA